MKLNNLLIAHRGIYNNTSIPENSIKAFEIALKNNIAIELDIQLTKDNVLVVFHDNNLIRLSNLDRNISKLTYKEICVLNLLETKEKIPAFKDVLALVNGKVLLDIEIKNTKKIKKICRELTRELKNYEGQYIIKSFNPRIIKYVKKLNSKYTTGLLINNKIYNTLLGKVIIKYSNSNFLAISKKYINKYGLNKYQKKYNILIWTIKDKKEINKYKNITTNYICDNLLLK